LFWNVAVDSTSASLLLRLRMPHEEAAWQRFVELYAPLIFHWGRGQGLNSADAADLVQEVLTTLIAKLPEFEYDPARRFRGWLRTIVVNKARDFQRRAAARPVSGNEATILHVAAAPSADLFEEAEYRTFLVNRAMELMRTEFRDEVWQACWKQVVEGRKAADVAQELGVSVNQVYLAKSRVLARLREELAGLVD
jgi:RNA polymerase sigma-70 factor (ECF subfamily)